MNVKNVEKENGSAKVTVEIAKDEFQTALDKAYAKIRKDIMIPGFRKGKAPRKFVERMYGSQVFYEDAVSEIFPDIYEAAIIKQELKAVGQPSVTDMQTPEDGSVVLTVSTELYPEVTLGEYKGNMIDRTELEKKLPKIGWGPEVCGAAWCEEDGVVDPLSLLRAFRAALPRVGVDYRQTLVFDVQPHAGGYRVTTKDGTFDCQKLVLAAGLSNRRFVQFAMPTLPVYADKGQVLLVERMPFVMPIPVLGVTQTFGGTTIIGFRHEKAGHHTQVVPSAVASEGKWAIRVWPELGKKRLIRAWAGLRVMPDDSMAIYSRLPGHPNVTLVNTHSAVTMAAAHTRLLPDFILGGELPETAQGMTLKRFGYSC